MYFCWALYFTFLFHLLRAQIHCLYLFTAFLLYLWKFSFSLKREESKSFPIRISSIWAWDLSVKIKKKRNILIKLSRNFIIDTHKDIRNNILSHTRWCSRQSWKSLEFVCFQMYQNDWTNRKTKENFLCWTVVGCCLSCSIKEFTYFLVVQISTEPKRLRINHRALRKIWNRSITRST